LLPELAVESSVVKGGLLIGKQERHSPSVQKEAKHALVLSTATSGGEAGSQFRQHDKGNGKPFGLPDHADDLGNVRAEVALAIRI
jgi:hypothetical protein